MGPRLFFFWCAIWASLMTVVSAIGSITHQALSSKKGVFRLWSRFWSRSMFVGMGIRVHADLRADLDPEKAYVFVCNHQVAIDIPVVSLAIPCPFGWVAKAELARTPFLGPAVRASPSVFIDRSHPKKSIESMRLAGQRIRDGLSVIIFPEGARSHGPDLAPFKRGAFQLAVEAGVPVVPVTILNAWQVFNEQSRKARPGRVDVVVGQPILLDDSGRKQLESLSTSVREVMERELAVWNRAHPSRSLPPPEQPSAHP
jgi:1-acyl-sn-glycerol-3-phosphate acyltransferase